MKIKYAVETVLNLLLFVSGSLKKKKESTTNINAKHLKNRGRERVNE